MSYIMINIMAIFVISLHFWNNQSAQISTFLSVSEIVFLCSRSLILTYQPHENKFFENCPFLNFQADQKIEKIHRVKTRSPNNYGIDANDQWNQMTAPLHCFIDIIKKFRQTCSHVLIKLTIGIS